MNRKRSSRINLQKMRKSFSPKPLAVGIAGIFLSACADDRQTANIYTSIQDCIDDNPDFSQQCQAAYEDALKEAERTGPKYGSQRDCEHEFGPNQCRYVESGSGSWFMPFIAGYMLSDLFSGRRYYSQPMYTSYSRYSPLRYRWMTADGYDYGDLRKRKYKVGKNAFTPKPAVKKTMSRGGFGSSVRAKSSWGSSRKGGWGG